MGRSEPAPTGLKPFPKPTLRYIGSRSIARVQSSTASWCRLNLLYAVPRLAYSFALKGRFDGSTSRHAVHSVMASCRLPGVVARVERWWRW